MMRIALLCAADVGRAASVGRAAQTCLAAAIPACIETVTIAMHGNEAGRRSAPALADALTARTARGIEVHLLGARS